MDWRWALFITGFLAAFGGLFTHLAGMYREGYEWLFVRALGVILISLGVGSMLFAILHGLWSSVEW